ncbi:MAG: hypothetical protein WC584_04310 [Candidatus Pacearchaeota archaeon]
MGQERNMNLVKELLSKETRNYLIMRQICIKRQKRIYEILGEEVNVEKLGLALAKYDKSKEKYAQISEIENPFQEIDEYIGQKMRMKLTK